MRSAFKPFLYRDHPARHLKAVFRPQRRLFSTSNISLELFSTFTANFSSKKNNFWKDLYTAFDVNNRTTVDKCRSGCQPGAAISYYGSSCLPYSTCNCSKMPMAWAMKRSYKPQGWEKTFFVTVGKKEKRNCSWLSEFSDLKNLLEAQSWWLSRNW